MAAALLAAGGGASSLGAQALEITPFGGLQFGGGFRAETGDVGVRAGAFFGASLDFVVRERGFLGFTYTRQATRLTFTPVPPDTAATGSPAGEETLFDATFEYIQAGGSHEFRHHGVLRPFISLTFGATRLAPSLEELRSEWRFSGIVGGGTKVFPAERVGLRFQFQLAGTFLSTSTDFFCKLPGGCLVVLDGEVMLQGALYAGAVFAI